MNKRKKKINLNEAKCIGDSLYIDWNQIDPEQFRRDLMEYQKQGATKPEMDTTYDSVLFAGKVVLTHMQEFPDYNTRLAKLRAEAENRQAGRK